MIILGNSDQERFGKLQIKVHNDHLKEISLYQKQLQECYDY